MDALTWCQIGYVIKKHGIRGEIRISLDTIIPWKVKALFIDQQNRPTPFFIERISMLNNIAIVKLEEVNTPEEATQLTQKNIYLPQDIYNKTPHKKNKVKQSVIGYHVLHNTQNIGTVKDVNDYAPNPLLVVTHLEKEILIPFNNYFIKKVNNDKKEIITTLPNGFLDL